MHYVTHLRSLKAISLHVHVFNKIFCFIVTSIKLGYKFTLTKQDFYILSIAKRLVKLQNNTDMLGTKQTNLLLDFENRYKN
jgi:hypothetical protein